MDIWHVFKNIIYLCVFIELEDASWTGWTSWETCRDDRLASYGISVNNAAYFCTHISGPFNQRRRTCENHANTAIKYGRFGGSNLCLGNHVSNEQDDWQKRTCPGQQGCPSMKHIRIWAKFDNYLTMIKQLLYDK